MTILNSVLQIVIWTLHHFFISYLSLVLWKICIQHNSAIFMRLKMRENVMNIAFLTGNKLLTATAFVSAIQFHDE